MSRLPLLLGAFAIVGGASAVVLSLAGQADAARKAAILSVALGGYGLVLAAVRMVVILRNRTR